MSIYSSIIQKVCLAVMITLGITQLPAIAQTTEEFVEALSPKNQIARTRGLGGVHVKEDPHQKAMYLNFGLNSAILTDAAKNTLNQLAAALKQDDLRRYTFRLEGHTCDRGSDALNMELSKRRAMAVQQYLIRNFGFPSRQLEVIWFGESQPAVPNTDETARQKNRRVMIVNTLKQVNVSIVGDNNPLQVRRLRNGKETVIADGEVMSQNDSYAIEFKTTEDRYIYIYQKDASGKLTLIFPNEQVAGFDNPLRPNSFYRLPGPGEWLFLDENKGTEEILMLAYDKPLQNPLASVREAVASDLNVAKTRGMGGIHRKNTEQALPVLSVQHKRPANTKTMHSKPQPESQIHIFKRYFVHE